MANTISKQDIVDKVIERIEEDISCGDVTALDELLLLVPVQYLTNYLSEN